MWFLSVAKCPPELAEPADDRAAFCALPGLHGIAAIWHLPVCCPLCTSRLVRKGQVLLQLACGKAQWPDPSLAADHTSPVMTYAKGAPYCLHELRNRVIAVYKPCARAGCLYGINRSGCTQ